MAKFSKRSEENLKKLHPLLQKLLREAIKEIDFTVTDATRGRAKQEAAVAGGFSKVHFPNSSHNWNPAPGADIYPAPIPKNMNTKAYRAKLKALQLNVIRPTAAKLGIRIRQGIDFNGNGVLTDDKFVDLPHVELDGPKGWRGFVKAGQEVKD